MSKDLSGSLTDKVQDVVDILQLSIAQTTVLLSLAETECSIASLQSNELNALSYVSLHLR